MSVDTISPSQLHSLIKAGSPLVILDVRLEGDHERGHLPGARSNCVFEVAFGDRLADTAPDKDTPVCVYGVERSSRESVMAAEKLRRAGYRKILNLVDGFVGWRDAGLPTEKKSDTPAADVPVPDGERPIDLKESRIEWTGRNLLNKHSGTVALKSGSLRFTKGRLTGGEFVFDMNAMSCSDLAGNAMHDVLIAHLKSDDFFDVEVYPEARFVVWAAEPIIPATSGAPNLHVRGQLTLKDVVKPFEFPVVAGFTPEGKPAAQAVLAFDRTLWNVVYGSGKLFSNLGGHLVNDQIEIQLRIVVA